MGRGVLRTAAATHKLSCWLKSLDLTHFTCAGTVCQHTQPPHTLPHLKQQVGFTTSNHLVCSAHKPLPRKGQTSIYSQLQVINKNKGKALCAVCFQGWTQIQGNCQEIPATNHSASPWAPSLLLHTFHQACRNHGPREVAGRKTALLCLFYSQF